MRIINRQIQGFAKLNAQALLNKNKNSVRFQAQNLAWDYEVVEYHSKAFAKGLNRCGFSKGDNFLLRVPSSQQAESFVAKVGTSYNNSNLIISKANTIEQFDKQISQHQIKGIIFEPTLLLGEKLVIDSLYELIPQIKSSIQGSQISASRYASLKMLIQTNFYTYPGVFKYRSIFDYSSDAMSSFEACTDHQPLNIPQSNKALVVTQPAHQFAFKAGILNSLVNGRYVVCAQSNDLMRLANTFDNKIELIATEECIIPEQIAVITEKGSGLFQNHKNRVQI